MVQRRGSNDPSAFTRGTSEADLDRFNQWLRSQPWHRAYLQRIGQADRAINLSERQQKELAQIAAQNGVQLPEDFSFDQAGNLNQNSRLGRNLALAGLIGGGALTGLGFAGLGPLSGLGGGAAAGAGSLEAPLLGGAVPGVAGTAIPPFAGAAGAGAGTAATTAGLAGAGSTAARAGRGARDVLTDLALTGGGGFLSALGESLFQERNSFKGTDADPTRALGGVLNEIRGALPGFRSEAFGPVSTSAYAQSLPGLSGRDPAEKDKGVTRPGMPQQSAEGGDLDELRAAMQILGGRR